MLPHARKEYSSLRSCYRERTKQHTVIRSTAYSLINKCKILSSVKSVGFYIFTWCLGGAFGTNVGEKSRTEDFGEETLGKENMSRT